MKRPAEPSTPSGPPILPAKATDHELQKHDKFTRYGQADSIAPATEAGRSFVYFGRLSSEKGIDVAIRAAALARQPLVLVGTGQEEVRLRRLAAETGADVTFAGYQSGAALYDIVRAARGTVLASTWYENAPMTILESYALGKPVLGADIGGIPELVRDGETGALSPSGHVTRLADRMRWLSELPDQRVRDMGRAGRAWVEREFSPAVYRERLLDVYGAVTGTSAVAAGGAPRGSWSAPVAIAPTPQQRPRLSVMMLGLRGCPDVQGGVERHVEHLGPRLSALGCDVEVVARKTYLANAAPRTWRGMHIKPLWSPGGRSSEAIVHTLLGVLYAAIRRPSILHIHAIGPSLMVPLARLLGLKVVVTHHGYDYERQKWGPVARQLLRLGERLGMRLAHGRITVSQGIASQMLTRHGVRATPIPNGVDFSETGTPASSGALAAFGVTPGRYVLMVGRLVREKRQLDLVDAFRRARLAGWKLVIVGAADHPDGYSRLLEDTVRGADDIVMTGFQTGATLTELYARAGMFVLPSSHEGLPIALLEAMSVGLPCLASDIEANREVALPEDCYFPVGDIAALAGRIEATARQPRSAVEVQRLKALVKETYDWQRNAELTLAVYRAALAGEPHSQGGASLDRARPAGV